MSKVAVVHEWFSALGGSEKVVEEVCGLFPQADLFAVYANPSLVATTPFLQGRKLTTSFIQDLPDAAARFRSYLMLMPLAIEQFDLSDYDTVISSNHAVAKGVLTGPDQLHISYVHSPLRYAWDLQHQYLREARLDEGLKGWLAKWMLHKMRIWDSRTASGVDYFVANSRFIARRIRKTYGRDATVIYPPVDVSAFSIGSTRDSFYLAVSRLVPYKRMDLIVEAFTAMPDKKLIVVGDGPEAAKVKAKAGPNVELLGRQTFESLRALMQQARAFVFAAEEDFGITLVEAQACGTPVITLGKGGALETIIGMGTPSRTTGVFFPRQEVRCLIEAVEYFERHGDAIDAYRCRENALRFSQERFRTEFSHYVKQRREAWRQEIRQTRRPGMATLPAGTDWALAGGVVQGR